MTSSHSMLYHYGNRLLQDQFDSRRIADRLEEKLARTAFTDDDKAFIESLPYFFLASADGEGRPDCSFKGGLPGFVRLTGPSELAFPDYDGNGMFKSLGNLTVNPEIGLLFIALHDKPRRLRVNGRAAVRRNDPLLGETVGAQIIVRVMAHAIFPNCPRYIPAMQITEPSIYAPRPGCDPIEPAWKGYADFKDCVHPRQKTARGLSPGSPGSIGPNDADCQLALSCKKANWGCGAHLNNSDLMMIGTTLVSSMMLPIST